MRHIEEILRLKIKAKLSHREIARSLSIGVETLPPRAMNIRNLNWSASILIIILNSISTITRYRIIRLKRRLKHKPVAQSTPRRVHHQHAAHAGSPSSPSAIDTHAIVIVGRRNRPSNPHRGGCYFTTKKSP